MVLKGVVEDATHLAPQCKGKNMKHNRIRKFITTMVITMGLVLAAGLTAVLSTTNLNSQAVQVQADEEVSPTADQLASAGFSITENGYRINNTTTEDATFKFNSGTLTVPQ